MSAVTLSTDEDFDSFIRQQKQKLLQDKQQTHSDKKQRKTWDTDDRENRLAEQRRLRTPPEHGLPLGNNSQESNQRKLAAERKKEYNDLLAKSPRMNKTLPIAPRGGALPLGEYEEKRARLAFERKEELQKYLEQNRIDHEYQAFDPNENKKPKKTKEEFDYKTRTKNFTEEKKKEYAEFVKKKQAEEEKKKKPKHKQPDTSRKENDLYDYDQVNREFNNQRRKEYEKFKQQERQNRRNVTPETERMGLPLGEYKEDRKKALQEERHREYEKMLKKDEDSNGQSQTKGRQNNTTGISQEFVDDKRNEYNNFWKQLKKEEAQRQKWLEYQRHSPTAMKSPQISPRSQIYDYDNTQKTFQDIKRQEYKEFVDRKMEDERRLLEIRKQEHEEFLKKFAEASPRPQEREKPQQNDPAYIQEPRKVPDNRANDYNERMREKELPKQKASPSGGALLMQGEYDEKKQQFDTDLKREYQEHMAKIQAEIDERQRRNAPPPAQPQTNYDYPDEQNAARRESDSVDRAKGNAPRNADDVAGLRKKLGDEKQREYQEFLDQLNNNAKSRGQLKEDNYGLPIGQFRYAGRQQKLQEERHREYNEMLAQKKERERQKELERNRNSPPPSPQGFNKLGANDRAREQLAEERKKEYNALLHEKQTRGNRQTSDGATLAIPERNSAQKQKMMDRNQDYNNYLKQLEEARASKKRLVANEKHGVNKPWQPLNDVGKDTDIEKYKRKDERNKEYNEFLKLKEEKERKKREQQRPQDFNRGRQSEPSKNFGSPSYEEMLERKRQEESDYRKKNDPGYEEYGRKRDSRTLNDGRFGEGILEDDNWLSPMRQFDGGAQYADMIHPSPQLGSYSKSPDHLIDNQPKWDSFARSPAHGSDRRLNQEIFSGSPNRHDENWHTRNGSYNPSQENHPHRSDLLHNKWSPEPRHKQDSFSKLPNHYQENLQNHSSSYNGYGENHSNHSDMTGIKNSRGPDRSKEYTEYNKFY